MEPTDQQWEELFKVQRTAMEIWQGGDLPQAIHLLENFLAVARSQEIRRKAMGFRADLLEEGGNLDEAKVGYRAALALGDPSATERYSLETAMAWIEQRQGHVAEAASWSIRAMTTAVSDDRLSGGSALSRLLDLRGEGGLLSAEVELAERVVTQAWACFQLEGSPPLGELRECCRVLREAQASPRPNTRF